MRRGTSAAVARAQPPGPAAGPHSSRLTSSITHETAITRAGTLRAEAGHPATLTFTASLGHSAATLQPYLGAGGHLVALREGDLAFLHVHPTNDAAGWAAGQVAFETQFPTPGRYRLFLQVQTGGAVRTAAFAQEVK